MKFHVWLSFSVILHTKSEKLNKFKISYRDKPFAHTLLIYTWTWNQIVDLNKL